MKHILHILITIAAVLVVGCAVSWKPLPTKSEISEWVILEPKSHNTEITHKSLNSRTAVYLHFQNNLNVDVEVYWLDYSGEAKSYGTIKSEGDRIQGTFSTHPWLIREKQTGEIVGFYITPEYSARVILDAKKAEVN